MLSTQDRIARQVRDDAAAHVKRRLDSVRKFNVLGSMLDEPGFKAQIETHYTVQFLRDRLIAALTELESVGRKEGWT